MYKKLSKKEVKKIIRRILKNKKKCVACGSETATYLYGKDGCNECIGEPWTDDEF